MLTVQAMIHAQDAGAALRKPDKSSGVGIGPGLRGNKGKRKSGKKKKDAAAGGDDTIGDIFVEVPQEAPARRVPEPGSVVAREWLLLKNTEVQEEQRSPHIKITRERRSSYSGRPYQDPASPPSLVPVRRKDSRPTKSNRTKDANGNRIGKGLRGGGQENLHVELQDELAAKIQRSVGPQELEEAPRLGDITLIRIQPPHEASSEALVTESPSRIPRKGSLHFMPEVIIEEDKEKLNGTSVSPGVKRHSSSRSTGSEGSTLRRRRRGTARSSASTQTPTGSHSDLPDCTIPPDKRMSVRTYEAPPNEPEEPPPRKDLTGSIPGASLLMKLVMPREKRSSKHSGGSPPHDGAQHGSVPSHGRSPSSPTVPWFWPPLRHIEAMTSLHSVFPGTKGPPVQPSPRCQDVAAGGGEAEAPGGMAMFAGDVVPFPPRAAPPVPRQVQGDQLSLSSLNSSLAGHTYEQVNFAIEPPICEYRENEYELSKSVSEDIHTYHIDKEDVIPKESYFIPRRSSDSRVAEVTERARSRRTSRRKRKKSRCAATITDDSLVGNFYPKSQLCPQEQVSMSTQHLSHSEEDEVAILLSPATPQLSPAASMAHRDLRWSSTTCSSSSSALGERHVATLEKPITLVSKTTLELGRSPSISPPLPECPARVVPFQDSSVPVATRDAAFIHRLLTLVKEDDSQSSGSGGPGPPDTRHNIRRRGVYVPVDTESDTGVTSEPEPSRGPRVTPSPDPRSEGDIHWPRRTSLASSMPDRRLCPVHGASSPHQASLAAASQRRRLRRASLPVPVPQEPRPSFFQRLRRSLRRSRNIEPLIAELPSPADVLGVDDVVPAAASEDPLPLSSIMCSCPDPVQEFRRFRPRLGSVVTLGSSDEDDRRLRPSTPQDACERWRVEGEVCRLQEALGQRLGSTAMIMRRRDHRLHTINTIEKTIQKLQQDTLRTHHNNQVNCNEESVRSCSPQAHHPTDIMDAVNANQLQDEDATGDDISEIREMDSLQTDPVPHHPAERTMQAKGRSSLANQNSTDLDSPTDTLLQQEIPPGKLPPAIEAVLRGAWPFEKALWHSSPASMGMPYKNNNQEVPGIMATSSVTNRRAQSTQQLLTNKVEMVYGLLSMFSSGDRDDMSRTLLAMSSSPDSCVAMRQSGCLPLLIQLLHGGDGDVAPTRETRLRASQALHNIVHSHPDDKRGRREARVLRLLEQIRDYSDYLYERLERTSAGRGPLLEDDMDRHPCPAMAALMKLSFDEDHRHAMCTLGGLHAIAELIRRDHEGHGSTTSDQYCITLRRYAGMALTNLTFGDGTNKALLCSFRSFMRALVSQLHSPSEDLRQVTASVLRNLSWRADGGSKASLRDVGAVAILMQAALSARKESTLKVILSAVWNLSAHCSINKAEICAVDGALAFICSTLTYKSQSKTLAIVENGGGILRNISSHIAVREDLRQVLREHNTLSTLLGQLRSPSLTVVSNACGTLWNLSARCSQDQRMLWELGAVPMLRSLINSKHKMISMGSSAALKNLLQARPEGMSLTDPRHGMGLPSLQARKQKALEQELDPSLSETCDNIETSPRSSPTHPQGTDAHFYGQPGDATQYYPGPRPMFHSLGAQYMRSESRDSISSTHSDNSHDRMRQLLMRHQQTGREGVGENGRPLDLSLRSMAPPSRCVPDIAHMSQDELQRHLESKEFNTSADEIFAARVRGAKEVFANQSNDSLPFNNGLSASASEATRNGSFSGASPQPPFSPRRRPSNNTEEDRSGTERTFVNGKQQQQQPHNEVHYNYYSKYVNYSRNLAEVDIENDSQDEPLNYSLKCGTGTTLKTPTNESMASMTQSVERPGPQIDNFVVERRPDARKTEPHTEAKREPENFGSYTETDLDQPTNFSLRAAVCCRYSEERDSDEAALYRRPPKPPPEPASPFFEPSVHDDSVKTYYTEGTPYETPYNFSTANSMTDLREPAIKEIEREGSTGASRSEKKKEKKGKFEELESIEDSDDGRDKLEPLPSQAGPAVKSGLSSGMMTPDKPVTYCVEGTPVSLSRFSSVSSLTSGEINANNARDGLLGDLTEDRGHKPQVTDTEKKGVPEEGAVEEIEDTTQDGSHTPSSQQLERPEGKSVHCEETPLMFSRATSVSSLSSFEVQSIHDDRSSVVSDFSRFTSGAISPSDLPDSPNHTVPPSPKRSRPPSQPFKPPPAQSPRSSTGVFSEAPRAFVEEGTPVEFSRATSLSSLTIDDDLPVVDDGVPRDRLRGDGKDSSETTTGSEASLSAARSPVGARGRVSTSIPRLGQERGGLSPVAREVEEEGVREGAKERGEDRSRENSSTRSSTHTDSESEDLLAECISSGMPDNTRRNKQQFSGRGASRIAQPSARPRGSGIPVVKTSNLPTQIPSGPAHGHAQQGVGGGVWGGDTIRTYCTEDTPASISHAASISDLSTLSIPGDEPRKERHPSGQRPSLNDSGDNSSDNDNLLEQCIQSAMPKARPGAKVKEVKLGVGVKRHGTGHLCAHGAPPPAGPPLASPRHSPHHRPVPVARVTPAVKVGGTRISPRPAIQEDTAGDQMRMWATEGTPATFSRADSLSSLSCDDDGNRASRDTSPRPLSSPHRQTPQSPQPQSQPPRARTPGSPRSRRSQQPQNRGQEIDGEKEVPQQFAVEGTPGVISRHSSLSSIEGEEESNIVQAPNTQQAAGVRNYGVEDTPVCFSRNSSLSSLSVESFGEETTPTEQALLQQCISQGMPKSKSDLESHSRRRRRGGSRIPAPSSRSPARLVPGVPMERLTLCRDEQPAQPKNAGAMAAAVDTVDADAAMPTADVESSKLHTDSEQSEKNELAQRHIKEEDFEDQEEDDESAADYTEADSEMTATTAELCHPHSDMTSEDSAPTVQDQMAVKKEAMEETEPRVSDESAEGIGSSPEEKPSWVEPRNSTEKSSPSDGRGSDTSVTASMSESGFLAMEAMRVARAVAGEAKLLSSDETSHMSQSITSATSDACIDNIKPPSAMGSLASMSNSLTNSTEEPRGTRPNNRRLECRHTRRVPEMVRRALGEQDYGSTENMASMVSSCHSNVDNIPPPSMMDDDMENSMISVASITSEVAEQRDSPPSPPADHTAMVAVPARQLAAIFQQEALNAASTLTLTGGDEASTYQEITDITEHEETVGPASDTELAADDLPADVPDLPQDGFSSPLCGSTHSSPNRQGTPRARRHLPKDRYRTFTRGDGEVSSDATPSQDTDPTLVEALPSSPLAARTAKQRRQEDSERFRTRTISSSEATGECLPTDSVSSGDKGKDKISPKKSPKNRRLQDPSRFQTHTISPAQISPEPAPETSAVRTEDADGAPSSPPKLQGKQNIKQRRQDRERYQTRTIEVPLADITPEPEPDTPVEDEATKEEEEDGPLVDFQDSNEMLDLTAEQLEALQQDANIVICTLNETREAMTSESSDLLSEENILDIETLSLISNEDESEMRNFLQDFDDDPPDKEDDDEAEGAEAGAQMIRRPRIVKPGERPARPQEDEDGTGKGIRGRRKPLYSSAKKFTPTRHVSSTVRSGMIKPSVVRPNSASPVKPSSPKLPRATRASALRQTSNIQKGGSSGEDSPTGRNTGSSAGSSAGSSPRLGPGSRTGISTRPARSKSLARPGPDPPKPLQRQNTFTKDDSDTPPSPEHNAVVDLKKTPTPNRSVKTRLRRDIVQPSPSMAQPGTAVRTVIPKSGSQDLSPTKGRPPQHKSASLTRDVRPPTSSDVAEWHHEGPKKTVKKEVTSRIANLWKKVERAQTKPKDSDKKVWITRPKSAAKESPPQPLVRSSTYEKLNVNGAASGGGSNETGKSRTRLGLKLAKLRGRDTRSSPPSEATTPVDPRPHCLVSPTRARVGEVTPRPAEAVQLRPRPATHPPGTHVGAQLEEDSEARAKRLSRLGSFIVVEEDGRVKSPPQSAIVQPFNYQPPAAPKIRSAVATRIPQPSKLFLSNTPCGRDDNGNAADPNVVTGAWRP